jgi:cyclopropane fatty-acyl-phospholipid synthase-like methyltransferase
MLLASLEHEMSVKDHYSKYVADADAIARYNAYQNKHKVRIRESDKVLIDLVARLAKGKRDARLLDIGCSTGNLLYHLKNMVPGVRLEGADLAQSSIDECRRDPDLAGIEFSIRDICDLPRDNPYDIIVANAVAVYFDWETYSRAMASVWHALKPGGAYLVFEWMHKFSVQDITITETSEMHPDGLEIHFRPMAKVERLMRECGFGEVEFYPFEMPFDLPFPGYDADVASYTRKDEHGTRMTFRGALFQPWCHMMALKPA